jgi:hypothetical protein
MQQVLFSRFLISLSILVGLFSCPLMAASDSNSFLEFGNDDFDAKKSAWVFNIGAEYLKYPIVLPSFSGTHHKIKDESEVETSGGALAFGGNIYLGAGISSTIKLGGFYNSNNNREVGKASDDVDIDLANTKSNYQVSAAEVSLSLNYLVESSLVNWQPFVEYAVGRGSSNIKEEYNFDGLTSAASDDENYKMESKETFGHNKLSLGINFISSYGLTSYFKVTRTTLNISERELKGNFKNAGDATATALNEKNKDLDEDYEVMAASIGAGYLF